MWREGFKAVVIAVVALLVVASSASGATIDRLGGRFPEIAQLRASLDSLDVPAAGASVGAGNSQTIAGRPGAYLVTSASLDLHDGPRRLDPTPAMAERSGPFGAVLVPPDPAYGIAVPASGSPSPLLLGSRLFDQVRLQLRGRAAGSVEGFEGGAIAPDALGGDTVVDFVAGGMLEEWVIFEHPRALASVAYDLSLPAGASMRPGSPGELLVIDPDDHPMLSITAPTAVDEAGAAYTTRLQMTGNTTFEVRVDTAGRFVTGAIALDPVFRLFNVGQYPNQYYVNLCGPKAGDSLDALDDSWLRDPCEEDPVLPGVLTLSVGAFDYDHSATGGMVLSMVPNVAYSKDASGSITINTPDVATTRISSANVRGHRYPDDRGDASVNDRVVCELTYDEDARNVVKGNNDHLLYAGQPNGVDDAWAHFPIKVIDNRHTGAFHYVGYTGGDIGLPEGDRFSHMRGFFDLNFTPTDQTFTKGARWIRFSISAGIDVTASQTADSSHRCAMDALWRIVVYDGGDPDVEAPNVGSGDARIDPARWYAPRFVRRLNNDPGVQSGDPDQDGRLARAVRTVRAIDRGSGVRDESIWVDGDVKDSAIPCAIDTEGDGRTTINEPTGTPCPSATPNDDFPFVPKSTTAGDNLVTAANVTAGRHSIQVSARDFTLRDSGPTALHPRSPSKPAATNVGWYWVDPDPPTCEVSATQLEPYSSMVQLKVSYRDPGHLANPQTGSGMGDIGLHTQAFGGEEGSRLAMPARDGGGVFGASVNGQTDVLTEYFDVRPLLAKNTPVARVWVDVADRTLPDRNWGKCSTGWLDIRVAPMPVVVEAVRGAGGVRGAWRPVVPSDHYLPTEFAWRCVDKDDGDRVIDSGAETYVDVRWYVTRLCGAAPGHLVEVVVDAVNEVTALPGYGPVSASDEETVDDRPDVQIGEQGFTSSDVLHFTFNGPAPTSPNLVVRVRDQDGNLFAAGAPSERFFASAVQAVDAHARLVVTGADPNGVSPSPDESFRVIVELDGTGAPRVVLDAAPWLGGDAFTLDLAGASGSQRCALGSGAATDGDWDLDCAASVITYSDTDGDQVADAAVVSLALRPQADTHDQLYEVVGRVRDGRQPADDAYLTAVSGAADEPHDSAGSVSLRDVVTDRLRPEFSHASSGQQGAFANFHTEPTGSIVTHFDGVDPTPPSSRADADPNPPQKDPTGLSEVSRTMEFTDDTTVTGTTTWSQDTQQTAYTNCSPSVPAAPTDQVTCDLTVTPVQLSPCRNFYRVVYAAVDVAGNHRSEGDVLSGCVGTPQVTVVRGASGVVGKWSPVSNGESYFWQCTTASSGDIAHGTIASDGRSTPYVTSLCPGAAGQQISVQVTAMSDLFAEESTLASETVDQRPQVAIGDGMTASDRLYYGNPTPSGPSAPAGTYLFNPRPNPNVVVDVSDPDGVADVTSQSSLDRDILPDVLAHPGTDHARLVLTFTDPPGDGPNPLSLADDVNDESFRLIIVLDTDTVPTVILDETPYDATADPFTIDPATYPASDQCTLGNGSITVGSWAFDCSQSAISLPNTIDCNDQNATVGGTTVRLCLALRPVYRTTAPTAAPDDQLYDVTAYLRDRQQAADDMYQASTSGSAGATVDPGGSSTAGATPLRDIFTDRIPPRVGSTSTVTGSQTGLITMALHDVRDHTPSAGGTLPGYLNPSGLLDVNYIVWFNDNSSPTTFGWQPEIPNRAYSNVNAVGIDPHESPALPSFGSGCTYLGNSISLPRPDPDSGVPPEAFLECQATHQLSTTQCHNFYLAQARPYDHALNNGNGIEAILTGCVGTPQIQVVRGAGGVAAKWVGVFNDARYHWSCSDDAGNLIDEGDVDAALIPNDGADPDENHTYHTPLCDADMSTAGTDPGREVTFDVTAYSQLYNASGQATGRVDRRPSITVGTDPDGGTSPRYDTLNGQLSTGDRFDPDGRLYSNGSRNRDVVVDVTDTDGDVRAASDQDDLFQRTGTSVGLLDNRGRQTRPNPDIADGDHARVVINIRDDHPNANSRAASLFVIVQLAPADGGVVVSLDQEPTLAAPFTRSLDPGASPSDTCFAGSSVTITTPQWKLDCSKLVIIDAQDDPQLDPNTVRLRIPVWPREADSTPAYDTPDQDYAVWGYVRDRRQAADNRYLSAVSGEPYPDPETDLDLTNYTELGTIVTDRVLPRFNTANANGLGTSQQGSIQLQANVNDPTRVSPPGILPTGIREVVYAIDFDTGNGTWQTDTPVADLGCAATTTSLASTCQRTVSVGNANQARYRVRMQVVDTAGNHAEDTHILTGAPAATTVSALRGATGVSATWTAVPGAASYAWQCTGLHDPNDALDDTVIAGGSVPASGSLTTGLCAAAPGEAVRVTVTPYGDLYAGPDASAQETVDRRPVVTDGTDPNGAPDYYDSLNGRVYDNGTTNRDIYLDVTDPDGNLRTTGASSDHARILVLMSASIATPNDSVRFIVRLGTSSASDLVAMQEFPFPTDRWAGIDDPLDAAHGYQTCTPGASTTLTTANWQLDCSRVLLAPIQNGVTLRLPAHPITTTPDERYDLSALARDQRQPADSLYLYNQPQGDWTDQSLAINDLTLDRHPPTGALTLTPGPSGSINVNATLHDALPGTDPTNPQLHTATGIQTTTLAVEYSTGPGAWAVDAPPVAITCTPPTTTDDTTLSCATSVTPAHSAPQYRVTLTITDTAANNTELQDTITMQSCTPGDIDTNWGSSGFAFDAGTGTSSTEANDAYTDTATGNIVWSGRFGGVNPTTSLVGRITVTGQPDATFATNGTATFTVTDGTTTLANPIATGVAATTDGAIVTAGYGTASGATRTWIARLNSNGTLDPSFGTGGIRILPDSSGEYTANEVAVDASNRIVIPGRRIVGGFRQLTLTRLMPDGSFDTTFGTGGQASVLPSGSVLAEAYDVDIQSDGRLVASGWGLYSGSFTDIVVARFNPDGTLDTTFGTGGIVRTNINLGTVEDVAIAGTLQPNGNIVVAGYTQNATNDYRFATVRLTTNGTLDTTFDTDGKVQTAIQDYEPLMTASSTQRAIDVTIDPTGTITLVGEATRAANNTDAIAIVRYTTTGTLDTTFSGNGVAVSTPPGNPPPSTARGVIHLANGNLGIVGVFRNPTTGADKAVTIAYCS